MSAYDSIVPDPSMPYRCLGRPAFAPIPRQNRRALKLLWFDPVMSRFMCQRVLHSLLFVSWMKIANRMRSIEVRSWKAPMGRVLRRTSRNRRSIALVVLTCLR